MTIKQKIIILVLTHAAAILLGMQLEPHHFITEVENQTHESVLVETGCTATVRARLLNQRSGPGESYDIVGSAENREVFPVMGWNETRQWLLASTSSGSAWMSARYLTLSGECSNVLIYDSMAARPTEPAAVAAALSATTTSTPTESSTGSDAVLTSPSSIFTTEVHYWSALISEWAAAYQIDPNLIATVIQIESCGNPSISSSAGAQGLFQVMPFHFAAGEDMLDVQTNALRGLTYLQGALELAAGDVELALAGYNGGYGVITRGRASWMPETQRYSSWGSRIYAEAVSGMTTSVTLQEWLAAGGSSLCASASESQRLIE